MLNFVMTISINGIMGIKNKKIRLNKKEGQKRRYRVILVIGKS